MKPIIVAIYSAILISNSLFIETSFASPPKTSEDATQTYEMAIIEAKRAFDTDIAAKRMSAQDATDRYQQTVSIAMFQLAVDLSQIARAVSDVGNHKKSIDLLDKSSALLHAATDFDRKVVALRLSRQDVPTTQPADEQRVTLFKNDPATSYQELCKSFVRALHDKGVSQQYEIDLKKTDSLITPYVGTFNIGDAHQASHEWRLTIVAQSGRWLIKRVEERTKDVNQEWDDTTDFKRVTLFVNALRSISNP